MAAPLVTFSISSLDPSSAQLAPVRQMISIRLLANAVDHFSKKCVEGLEADRERCEEMIEKSLALATALTPKIGYDEAARIAQKAYNQRKTIRQVVEGEGILSKKELNRWLNPVTMTGPVRSTRTKK